MATSASSSSEPIAGINLLCTIPPIDIESLDPDDQECIICKEPYTSNSADIGDVGWDIPVKLQCGHIFGLQCLAKLVFNKKVKSNCPLCLKSIINLSSEPQNIPSITLGVVDFCTILISGAFTVSELSSILKMSKNLAILGNKGPKTQANTARTRMILDALVGSRQASIQSYAEGLARDFVSAVNNSLRLFLSLIAVMAVLSWVHAAICRDQSAVGCALAWIPTGLWGLLGYILVRYGAPSWLLGIIYGVTLFMPFTHAHATDLPLTMKEGLKVVWHRVGLILNGIK